MSVRSLNKVILIGNLTRDPELRYTPAGTAVCTIGLATNRTWTTQSGETKEETEFHRIVAWNKLAELCAQLMSKGRKVYVEGRLATHSWTGQDGSAKTTTEIVIEDMILLDSRKVIKEEDGSKPAEPSAPVAEMDDTNVDVTPPSVVKSVSVSDDASAKAKKPVKKAQTQDEPVQKPKEETSEDITPDDIPF